jgi:Mg-chelatase subunit ChlI
MAKLPSQNPLATRLRKTVKDAEDRKDAAASAALLRGAVERGNREQARETQDLKAKRPMAKGGKVMKHASKAGNAMKKKSADTMGRAMKKYAKGGSVDGCATKGKTKGKMVKMAMGGMAGYKRGGKTC